TRRQDLLGQRVGREDHLGGITSLIGDLCERVVHPLGDDLEKTWELPPRADWYEFYFLAQRLSGSRHVLVGRHRRRMGCERETDDDVEAVGAERFSGRLEQGRFVLRTETYVEASGSMTFEGRGDPRHLIGTALRERRRATYGVVAALKVSELLGRRRATVSDSGVVHLDVIWRRRRAVGHDEHADRHRTPANPSSCTTRTTASSVDGSVEGKTPWPRLKMCPASLPARAITSRAPSTARSTPPKQRAGSRFPWTARPPTRRRPSSRSTCQSIPITELLAALMSSSNSPVPTPKRIVGTPKSAMLARTRSVAGNANRRDSSRVRAPAHESKSCTTRAPSATWARRNVIVMSVSRSRRRSKRSGSACIRVLMSANSRVGPPSTR